MKAFYVRSLRFHDQMSEKGDINEREGFFRLKGTNGEHTSA